MVRVVFLLHRGMLEDSRDKRKLMEEKAFLRSLILFVNPQSILNHTHQNYPWSELCERTKKTFDMSSTKRTTHLRTVQTKSGTVDNRYTSPQFVKKDGTRDMRTSPTRKR